LVALLGEGVSTLNTSVMGGSHVRVSDLERDEVARSLRDHCAVGRLTIDELDDRLEGVYRALTQADLWPGIAAFREERHLAASCGSGYADALREIVPRMALHGFHLVEEIQPRRLRFRHDLGLDVTVMFHPAVDGGCEVSAFGRAPRRVRKAFATLRD
jgi:hypothetical protein